METIGHFSKGRTYERKERATQRLHTSQDFYMDGQLIPEGFGQTMENGDTPDARYVKGWISGLPHQIGLSGEKESIVYKTPQPDTSPPGDVYILYGNKPRVPSQAPAGIISIESRLAQKATDRIEPTPLTSGDMAAAAGGGMD